MADYQERSMDDLTEEASPYKLEEMRRKGQVAQSKELTSTLIFLGVVMLLSSYGKDFGSRVSDYMKDLFQNQMIKGISLDDTKFIADVFRQTGMIIFAGVLPVFAAVMGLGIAGSIAQTQGLLINEEGIKVDFSHVNPLSGFKKIFSGQNLFQGFKSVVKFLAITGVVYFTLKKELFTVPNLALMSMSQTLVYLTSTTVKICFTIGAIMIAISGADYFFQWWNFRKQARMTKAEAKQESKEREGDPQIKARIRAVQREMARKRMMASIQKADVIITNPTHIAIAVMYEKDLLAPKVVAKGGDHLAQKIKEVARLHGVPIVENVPLARALYKSVKVGQMIPRSMYQAVAEILAYVYKIRPKEIFTQGGTHPDGDAG